MVLFSLLMFVPFLGAVLLYWYNSERAQSIIGIGVGAVVFGASVLVFSTVRGGDSLAWIPRSLGIFSPSFRMDSLSGLFSLFSAFVWLAAGIYMWSYMKHEKRTLSFYVFYLITLGAVQGIFAAGDLVTLLLFFEIMTVSSFFWVIHNQDRDSLRAGYFYLFLSVAAGLCLAGAIELLKISGSSLQVGVPAGIPKNITMFTWGILLLIAGFGVKAGMVPLHIWLPMAHPVAPTPGSALLSGILIKCGAYGLIRTGQFLSWGQADLIPWIGVFVTVIGVVTMVLGVCLALLQGNAKRLLAYHSISQMGYIILGIGVALFLQNDGVLGVSGAIFHSLNHALFKSALFLGVGIVYLGTNELDLYRLGGLWRDYPFTALMMLIAAFGITGTPGLNGYVSKTLLHHAVSQAASTGVPVMVWAERFFLVVGVGTTASFVKLFSLTFLGKKKTEVADGAGEKPMLALGMALLAAVMVFVGTRPYVAINQFIAPATVAGGMSDLTYLQHVNVWAKGDLLGMVITLAAGIVFFIIGMKTHLFHYQPPAWLSIESFGKLFVRMLVCVGHFIKKIYTVLVTPLVRSANGRPSDMPSLQSQGVRLLTVLGVIILCSLVIQFMGFV
ncbi:MAG: NADH dehydrogenase [Firmicutes bacterium]|nr:NADH dehydrogenase [Bacillota bacterium]